MTTLAQIMPDYLVLEGIRLPLKVSRHHNARRMTLRFDAQRRLIRLTLPPRAPAKLALKFLQEKRDWLAEQMLNAPPPKPFEDGMRLPIHGKHYTLVHVDMPRGRVELKGNRLIVPALPEHFSRRTADWLKAHAREALLEEVKRLSAKLGVRFKQVRVRDTSSRWGSCSTTGNLSFSWRLIFAPPHVLTYLVAHEVAHLKEMHHGPAFWAAVSFLDPHHEKARAWLHHYGTELHGYGADY